MDKPIIAIDIDDVLSNHAEGFIAYTNKRYGMKLKIEDYTENWHEVWGVDLPETQQRSAEFHASGTVSGYRPVPGAQATLQKLKKQYRLVVVTSRNSVIIPATEDWLSKHYPGLFEAILFTGIFDKPLRERVFSHTKAGVLESHGVQYFIDDQLKHCLAAAEHGIKTVLFGDYSWNRANNLPSNITRCRDWAAVKEYFNE